MFSALLLLSISALSAAQSTGLSSNCQNSLLSIASNSDAAACLSPASLISVLTTGQNSSIIDPINNWLTTLCSSPACSNQTLSAAVTNLTSGCTAELSVLGLASSDSSTLISTVQEAYPTLRRVACLKQSNELCVTSELTDIQEATGTLSLTNIVSIAANTSLELPTSVTCSDCNKAAYNILSQNYPSLVSDTKAELEQTCGASFTDGATPSGVSESASTSTSAPNAATTIVWPSTASMVLPILLVVSSVFALIA